MKVLCAVLVINFFQVFAYDYFIVEPQPPPRRNRQQFGNNGQYIQSISQKKVSPDITVVDVIVNEPNRNGQIQNVYPLYPGQVQQNQSPYPNNPFLNKNNNPDAIEIIKITEPVGPKGRPHMYPNQYPNNNVRPNPYPHQRPNQPHNYYPGPNNGMYIVIEEDDYPPHKNTHSGIDPNTYIVPDKPKIPKTTKKPHVIPTEKPYIFPTEKPHTLPTEKPYILPTEKPYIIPDDKPYVFPTEKPHVKRTEKPIIIPDDKPYVFPTEEPKVPPKKNKPNVIYFNQDILNKNSNEDSDDTSEEEIRPFARKLPPGLKPNKINYSR